MDSSNDWRTNSAFVVAAPSHSRIIPGKTISQNTLFSQYQLDGADMDREKLEFIALVLASVIACITFGYLGHTSFSVGGAIAGCVFLFFVFYRPKDLPPSKKKKWSRNK